MIEITGNLFNVETDWLVITTNGFVKNNGRAVMGRGCALEAKTKIPDIDLRLGQCITAYGNTVHKLTKWEGKWIIAFPVKHHWIQDADMNLIMDSAYRLKDLWYLNDKPIVTLPRPGCGNGRLDWNSEVSLPLGYILDDDRFRSITFA